MEWGCYEVMQTAKWLDGKPRSGENTGGMAKQRGMSEGEEI